MADSVGNGGRTSAMNRRVIDDDNDGAFTPQFTIELGHVAVTDEDSGTELVQWKARSNRAENVSDSPTDAVMGLIWKLTDGEL